MRAKPHWTWTNGSGEHGHEPTQCQHDDKPAGPRQTVEERPVLSERLHEGLAPVVDGEGRDLQQQQQMSIE